jgi:hypothetical protein
VQVPTPLSMHRCWHRGAFLIDLMLAHAAHVVLR